MSIELFVRMSNVTDCQQLPASSGIPGFGAVLKLLTVPSACSTYGKPEPNVPVAPAGPVKAAFFEQAIITEMLGFGPPPTSIPLPGPELVQLLTVCDKVISASFTSPVVIGTATVVFPNPAA